MRKEQLNTSIIRQLTPGIVTTLYYYLKYGAKISLKAEVDLTPSLVFGKDAVVSSYTKIKASSGYIQFGNRVNFAAGCYISAGTGGLITGDNFMVGPHVNIIAGSYKYHKLGVHMDDLGTTSRGIRIGSTVFVGAGATILDGTVIGDNTIIVANSLLNRHYPPDCILKGNPAKVIKRRGGFGAGAQ